jgi:hypothetical protein
MRVVSFLKAGIFLVLGCLTQTLGASCSNLPKIIGTLAAYTSHLKSPGRTEFIAGMAQGGRIYVGEPQELLDLLLVAGAEPSLTDAIGKIVGSLHLGDLRHEPLESAMHAFHLSSTRKDLLVCVLDKDCNLKDAHSLAIQVQTGLVQHSLGRGYQAVTNFDELRKMPPETLSQLLQEDTWNRNQIAVNSSLHKLPYLSHIFVSSRSQVNSDFDLSPGALLERVEHHFFHELGHYADTHLFNSWIEANMALNAKGHNTDVLFDRFTIKIPGRPTLVDKVFRTFFTESRSYSITAALISLLFKDIDADALDKILAYEVLRTTVIFRGAHVLEYFSLPTDIEKDIADVAVIARLRNLVLGEQSLAAQMRETIQRAQALGLVP